MPFKQKYVALVLQSDQGPALTDNAQHGKRAGMTAFDTAQLFDRMLLRQRRQQTFHNAPSFLHDFTIEDLASRLSMINRDLPVVAATSTAPGLTGAIKLSTSAKSVITMDSTNADIVADEEILPFKPESLSCIISLLTLQFANDLPGALIQMRRALRPDGLFIAAMLGGESLNELRSVFVQAEDELAKGVSPRIAPFIDVRDAGSLLQRAGFALPVVDSDTLTARYDTMLGLIEDLRLFGWANALTERSRRFMRRDVLMRAGELYKDQFADDDGRLPAKFQIIWLTGWAPHESQQKPLRPGSAKMRLADALETKEFPLKNGPDDSDT